jgi:AAA ATPase domain
MADDFDPSPHPSKRRKTYATGRTTLKPPDDRGTLRSVSNALSGISNRIFGRGEIQKAEELHDDSAYGSKEDSLNEDEIVVAEDNGVTNENDNHNGDTTGGTRNTRRSSRRTAVAEDKIDTPFPGKDDDNVRLSHTKSAKKTSTASSTRSPKPMPVKAQETRRRSGRKITQAEELEAPVQDSRSGDKQRASTTNKKTASTQPNRINTGEAAEVAVTEEAFTESSSRVVDGEAEEAIEVLPGSSGRDRKKTKRFSTEQSSVGEYESADREMQDGSPRTGSRPITLVVSPQPKGILTPSRGRREGTRKSVVFDENDGSFEERLGFKDIDLSSKKSRKSPAEQAEIPETPQTEPENEDDVFIDQNPPQDILHELELPLSVALSAKRQPDDSPAIAAIKSTVLSRLTSSSATSTPPAHLSTQYSTLHSLLTSTIAQGESNSLLLLGSRGAGKSLLIDTAMSDLSAKHPSDFHVVRLNGFLQTDDRLALREIWRQLGREREGLGEVDEQETTEVSGSYADTMASLLSLLSHPDDFEDQVEPTAMDVELPTVKTSKSVVIVLDEFDLFTFHPRQTLLYNLFDIAQSKKAPIAVIGCSTRMDVVDCLEKRVKSRFSHRWLHVPSIRSLEGVKEVLETNLCVNQGATDADEREGEKGRWNHYIKVYKLSSSPEIWQAETRAVNFYPLSTSASTCTGSLLYHEVPTRPTSCALHTSRDDQSDYDGDPSFQSSGPIEVEGPIQARVYSTYRRLLTG